MRSSPKMTPMTRQGKPKFTIAACVARCYRHFLLLTDTCLSTPASALSLATCADRHSPPMGTCTDTPGLTATGRWKGWMGSRELRVLQEQPLPEDLGGSVNTLHHLNPVHHQPMFHHLLLICNSLQLLLPWSQRMLKWTLWFHSKWSDQQARMVLIR